METKVGVWRVVPRGRGVMPSFIIIYKAVWCANIFPPYSFHFLQPEDGECNICWYVRRTLRHSCLQIFAAKVQCITSAFWNMPCKMLKVFQCFQPLPRISHFPKHFSSLLFISHVVALYWIAPALSTSSNLGLASDSLSIVRPI
jgi:hypothetical protein